MQRLTEMRPSALEEDGDEVFIPIAQAKSSCCRVSLSIKRQKNGLRVWTCSNCHDGSYGIVEDAGRSLLEEEER